MPETRYAKSHHDLIVYQKARILAQEIFEMTKSFPKKETYSLTDQVRRSSRSVGAQIAEAWAKRPYEKHFISKLTDADGEQHDTQHWIEIAKDCGYISRENLICWSINAERLDDYSEV
jgi:four helix bundle protein